jgi:sortase B
MGEDGARDNYTEKRKWVFDSQANKTRRTKIAISLLAAVLCILLLIICVYLIIPAIISDASDRLDRSFANKIFESTLVSPRPAVSAQPAFVQPDPQTSEDKLKPRDCFATALSENPDTVGRIMIVDIGIAYLVVQADDNDRYLNTGYAGSESKGGAVFLDYRSDADAQPLKGHYILYGHNMKNGTMFHNLMEYKDKDTFYANRIIRFDTLYEDHTWEIFSAYVTSTDFYYIETAFAGDKEWFKFLGEIKKKSMYETNTILSPKDVMLTLSTCTYEFENARFVVHARLIK